MSFEQSIERERLEGEYSNLKENAPRVLRRVQEWKSHLDDLKSRTTDSTEIAEIDAVEASMVSQLRSVFGI